MIEDLEVDGQWLGYKVESDHVLFVCGGKLLDRERLQQSFSPYQFCFLHQVHGRDIVEGTPGEGDRADGHVTDQKHRALAIKTADCAPVLLASQDQVGALHAGWRGVAANIVGRSRELFRQTPHLAVIGPHIRFDNFEIGLDVRDQLLAATPKGYDSGALVRPHQTPDKCFFDLAQLIKYQLLHHYPGIQIVDIDADTITNPHFHSHRRDKDQAGRQYSFVVLKR